MKRNRFQIVGLCLAIVLLGILPILASGCSSTTSTGGKGPTLVSLALTAHRANMVTGSDAVLPSPVVLTKGDTTVKIIAVGTYSDGATMEIQQLCDWVVSNTAVATVGPVSSPGVIAANVKAVGVGTTAVSGKVGNITSQAITIQVQ